MPAIITPAAGMQNASLRGEALRRHCLGTALFEGVAHGAERGGQTRTDQLEGGQGGNGDQGGDQAVSMAVAPFSSRT